jgi:hypothetical protein
METGVLAMGTTSDLVLEETRRFRAALPALLADPALRGRCVVFKDGKVQSVHDDESAAYSSAQTAFGVDGAYVIGRVVPSAPTPITTAVIFGLSHA